MRWVFPWIVCFAPFADVASGAETSPALESCRTYEDRVIAEVDGKTLLVDIRVPTQQDKPPLVVWIHDCKGAIRWLRAKADEFGYDADRIGVAGSSAGGHLAVLLGSSGDVEELEGTRTWHAKPARPSTSRRTIRRS